jgi:hypothetical protein
MGQGVLGLPLLIAPWGTILFIVHRRKSLERSKVEHLKVGIGLKDNCDRVLALNLADSFEFLQTLARIGLRTQKIAYNHLREFQWVANPWITTSHHTFL